MACKRIPLDMSGFCLDFVRYGFFNYYSYTIPPMSKTTFLAA